MMMLVSSDEAILSSLSLHLVDFIVFSSSSLQLLEDMIQSCSPPLLFSRFFMYLSVFFVSFRFLLQLLLQVDTSSQTFSHFFLHVNGRLHVTQILVGRFSFFTPLGIVEKNLDDSLLMMLLLVQKTILSLLDLA
jgi:hypothetical protein